MDSLQELPYDLIQHSGDMQNRSAQNTTGDDDHDVEDHGCCSEVGSNRALLSPRSDNHMDLTRGASQLAIIGAKYAPLESLNYEIIENDVFKHDWRMRTRAQIMQYIILKWTLACFVGLLTGVAGFVINLAVENIAGFKLLKVDQLIQKNRLTMAFGIVIGSNLLLVLSSSLLCAYISPSAAGSGIPEVKAYLNGINAPNILSPGTLFVKVLGSIGSVAGGLYVGKEGPLVHIGACIAYLICQGGSKRYHLTWKWLRYFKNDRDRRDLVTCGAAAGVTAAFRAPVGGILFALEEVASWWRASLLWRAFFTTAVVAVILQTTITYCGDRGCGLFGSGGLIMYNIGDVSVQFRLLELVPALLLGLLGGFLGSLFTYFNGKIVKFYMHWHNRNGPMIKILHAGIVSLITSTCIVVLPWVGACSPCPFGKEDVCPTMGGSGNFKQFTCPDGHYNDLASLFFNINDEVVRNLFSVGTANEFQYRSLVIYLVSSFFLALFTYGIPVPSGLFIPVIIIGATYGRITGMFMRSLCSVLSDLDEGLYAVLGAASFVGGSMRMTVSICVVLLELTNNLYMLPLTMLVLLISKTIGDFFNYSVYDQILQIKELPFLQEYPEPYMKHLTALDVCNAPLVTLNAVETVSNVASVLTHTNHNAFPVIDEDISEAPILYGVILRSHLLVLLKSKEFLVTKTSQNGAGAHKFYRSSDFSKPPSEKGDGIYDIQLTASELEMFIDLRPFSNTSPYTVVESMSLAKAFTLFRRLGLRHLCVVPKVQDGSPVIGILTRHDFMDDYIVNRFPHLKNSRWRRLRLRRSIIQKVTGWWNVWFPK